PLLETALQALGDRVDVDPAQAGGLERANRRDERVGLLALLAQGSEDLVLQSAEQINRALGEARAKGFTPRARDRRDRFAQALQVHLARGLICGIIARQHEDSSIGPIAAGQLLDEIL